MTACRLHVARTVCRRAERLLVSLMQRAATEPGGEAVGEQALIYLNRLSDLLFTYARLANRLDGVAEPEWNPEKEFLPQQNGDSDDISLRGRTGPFHLRSGFMENLSRRAVLAAAAVTASLPVLDAAVGGIRSAACPARRTVVERLRAMAAARRRRGVVGHEDQAIGCEGQAIHGG